MHRSQLRELTIRQPQRLSPSLASHGGKRRLRGELPLGYCDITPPRLSFGSLAKFAAMRIAAHLGELSQRSPENLLCKILSRDLVILLKLFNTYDREKVDATVRHFFIHHVSATIFRKETVSESISHLIDAFDGA